MSDFRNRVIRLASTMKKGSSERKALLDVIAGCEKLPEGPMRDNCEKKKEEGKGDKKASVPQKLMDSTVAFYLMTPKEKKEAEKDAGAWAEKYVSTMKRLKAWPPGASYESVLKAVEKAL